MGRFNLSNQIIITTPNLLNIRFTGRLSYNIQEIWESTWFFIIITLNTRDPPPQPHTHNKKMIRFYTTFYRKSREVNSCPVLIAIRQRKITVHSISDYTVYEGNKASMSSCIVCTNVKLHQLIHTKYITNVILIIFRYSFQIFENIS